MHQYKVWRMDQDAKGLGIPLMITEFGACTEVDPCITEVTQVTDLADEYLASWAYWQFKTFHDITTQAGTSSQGFYNPDGSLQTKKVKALARTYTQYAQGTLLNMHFDSTSKAFSTEVLLDTSIDSPTIVFTNNAWNYPNGVNVSVSINQKELSSGIIISKEGNYTKIMVNDASLNGQKLLIKIE